MSGEVDHASERTVARYSSLDKKVELLIERMSECVRFVREYMQERTPDQQLGDKYVFGLMLRDFPLCIEKLARIQNAFKGVRLRGGIQKAPLMWKLKTDRATALRETCREINTFWNEWEDMQRPELQHIRNEMNNLIKCKENLYPTVGFGGFTKLDTEAGALIKWYNEDKNVFVVVGEHVWQTVCAACLDGPRELVLLPCNHFCLCRECCQKVRRCPICRRNIECVMSIEEVMREGKDYIQSTQFPGREEFTRMLLMELETLGMSI